VPIGGACLRSSSWDVTPAFSDAYCPDNASADRDEKPFSHPPTTTLPKWENDYNWSRGDGYAGWHSSSSSAQGTYGIQNNFLGHYGLWLWPAGGKYARNDYAEWTYTAPGTTRISAAKLWFLYRNKLLAHHCLEVGLRTASGTVLDQNTHCKPTWWPDWQRGGGAFLVDRAANPAATVLFFRIRLGCRGRDRARLGRARRRHGIEAAAANRRSPDSIGRCASSSAGRPIVSRRSSTRP